jgi:hypothetical protein
VTAEFGSVDRFAEIIRGNSTDQHDVYVSALAVIDVVSGANGLYDDSVLLDRVRNVVAAARMVRDELRGGDR